MRKLLLLLVSAGALVASLSFAQATHAQATVVSGSVCPSSNVLNVGNNRPLIETQQGALCTSGSGSGSTNVTAQGTAADGAAASGNPQTVAGVYHLTVPTYSDGQVAGFQFGTRGSLNVTLFGPNSAASVGFATPTAATAAPNSLDVIAFGMATNGTTFDPFRNILGAVAAGNVGTGTLAVEEAGRKTANMTTATTTTIKSGAGFLHTISLNTIIASATIQCFDNTTATGTSLLKLTMPSTITATLPGSLTYDVEFGTGLTCIQSALSDTTFSYR